MDGVDCDWCLVCEKHTTENQVYCSEECRLTDLISSSASSTASSASSTGSIYLTSSTNNSSDDSASVHSSQSNHLHDNYPMPPFIRKQRTSIPNIYAHCTSNPNPHPSSLMFTPAGGNSPSALSHHLHHQKQQLLLQQQQQQQQDSLGLPPPPPPLPGASAAQYPLFYATLNALRPNSPMGAADPRSGWGQGPPSSSGA